ncbi:MAG: urate hydroxylase PuuD [Myxococcales bacterium]|nr:urate hydroxylase PuuD [Myxococcales bacterium]
MLTGWIGEWLNLLLRWAHLVIGAAWIGASFYFNWLNQHVRPPEGGAVAGLKGELWAVHGGAFYRVHKIDGAPEQLPSTLHWFKYEAYFTWVTGVLLLAATYWANARAYMLDTSSTALSPAAAVGVGVATLVVGWVVYDGLCRTLARRPTALALVGFAATTVLAWGLSQVLSDRAAYIHVGAMLGTCMAANVFFVIIPGQRAMVDAMVKGEAADVARGEAGALRSLHNNYLTFPVLFIMVSNHYPVTWGHPYNWALLAAISLFAIAIRHWQNLRGRGEDQRWLLAVGVLGILATAGVSRWPSAAVSLPAADGGDAVSMVEVQQIVARRCLTCHATRPTFEGLPEAPKGLVLESPEDIRRVAAQIHAQTIATQVMPLGNVTQMTEEERARLGQWLEATLAR